jgi:hypothetical protein
MTKALEKQAAELVQGTEEQEPVSEYNFEFLKLEHKAVVKNKKVLLEETGYSCKVGGTTVYFENFTATVVRKAVRYVHKGAKGKALVRSTYENGYTAAEGFQDTNGGYQCSKKTLTEEQQATLKENQEKISSEVWLWMNITAVGTDENGNEVDIKDHRVQFSREGRTGFELNNYLSKNVKKDNAYFHKVVYFSTPDPIEGSNWFRAVYAVGDDAELTQATIDTLTLANESIDKANAGILKQFEEAKGAEDINADLE